MKNVKRFNKGLSILVATTLVLGGTSQVVHAATETKMEVTKIASNKLGTGINNQGTIKNGLYDINIKTLQEKNDSPSMAGGYLEKVSYELKDGKSYYILSLDSIDWMKNISVTVDGKEIKLTATDIVKKQTNDGKGKEKGKVKFEVSSLDSKVMLHMNVVPMGNARVAFRVIPIKDTLKLIQEYKEKDTEETKGQGINVTTLPKIETTELGKFYGDYDKYRISFPGTTDKEFEEFEKYIKAINDTNEVTVNGVKYSNEGLVNQKDNYHFGTLGFDLNPSAFTQEINTITVKANGYNDMEIKIKKDGTFVSQEEIKVGNVDNTKPKQENKVTLPKIQNVEYGNFYSSMKKYRINFISKTDDEWNCVNEYRTAVNKTNKVTVNGINYNSGNEEKQNNYSFGRAGFDFNPNAFKDGINTIVIKADGYQDTTIKIKKDGEKVSIEESTFADGNISKPEKPTDTGNIGESTEGWRSVTTLPKITKSRYGEIYGRVEYEISFEQNDKLQKYINAASAYSDKTKLAEVTVNGVRYQENFNFSFNEYHLSYMGGLELNDKAFTQEINTIVVKVDGYNDMRIKIKKDGTLISQEEFTVGTEIKENIQINIMKDITVTSGEKINLMDGVLAHVTGKEKIDLTDKIKVNAGKLDVNNPKEGSYEVTYSVTYNGQTETAKRKVIVNKGNVATDKLTDGVYTIGFKAYRYDIPKNESMLGGFFDEKAKVEVKNGKITLTMLNTMYAFSLLDFRIESNGNFISAKGQFKGEADSQGQYQMQTYEVPISDLTSDHLGCVLVGMMGGSKNDIGKFDKYKKVRFVFDKTCIKGWNGFNKDKEVISEKAEFNKALIKAGLDKNGDGTVTDEEIAKAKGVVDLTGKKIKDISRLRHLGSDVTELRLSANNISNLPKGIFDGLTGLEKLSLSSNRIVELPEGIFDKLTNLRELSLAQNYISKLPKGIFDKLKNLKSLGFTENKLKELPNDVFDNLTALEGLYLYDNQIENIPTGIGNLKKLKTLAMNKNKIEKVPEELSNLNNLTSLSLNNNFIKEIPNKVYKGLKNLSSFEIYDNELTSIPDNIKELLPKVVYFNFQLNKLNKKPNVSNLSEDGFYPQKNSLNLQLTAKNGKLTWKQDLSALDLYVWGIYMNDCSSINEYKKKLNGTTAKEYLTQKSRDWTIITEIQKKDSTGKYITIKEIVNENEKDATNGTYNDADMKAGDEYRITKSVISTGAFERRIFGDMAMAKATQYNKDNTKDKVEKNALYQVSVKALQEKSDAPSMANTYIQKVNYEIKNGKKYIIVSLNRLDWMKNIKVTVDGKEITPQITDIIKNKDGEEQGKIRFEVGSLDSKIMLNMNVVPMGNARVAFRLIPDKNTLTLVKENKNTTNTQKQATKKNNKETSKGTQKQIIKEINKDISNEGKEEKNDTIKEESKLPKTGMPVNTKALATLGTIITALGFALRKKK